MKGILNFIQANPHIYNTPTKVLEALLQDAKDGLWNVRCQAQDGGDWTAQKRYWKGRVVSLKIALAALEPGGEL